MSIKRVVRATAPTIERHSGILHQIARISSIVFLIALVVGSLLAYPSLPERIPTHFDFAGRPDGWSDKGIFSWFLLPILGILMQLLNVGCIWIMRRNSIRINMPDKKLFDELPPEGKQQLVELTETFLYLVFASIQFLFLALLWGAYEIAHGAERVPPLALGVQYLVFAIALLSGPVFLWYVSARVRHLHRTYVHPGGTDS